MSCFIGSNNNRVYGALESVFGSAAAFSAVDRLPLSSFRLKERRVAGERRDKTGSRTYPGAPNNGRHSAILQLACYLTEWEAESGFPAMDPILQAVTGGPVKISGPNSVDSYGGSLTLTTAQPHDLEAGQAISCGNEVRFVDAIADASTVILNARFTSDVYGGLPLNRAVTYTLGDLLKSLTLYDYWDPLAAVQRGVSGVGFEELRININGDFHEMTVAGEGRNYFDSVSFVDGIAGLSEFPPEPIVDAGSVKLIPGTLGQAWIGSTGTQSYNVLLGSVRLRNGIDFRRREFGSGVAGCIAAGARDVRLDLQLSANASADMAALFAASRVREPLPIMFQLGDAAGQLCGVYMKSVVPEVPSFEDSRTKLEWSIRDARAQGSHNDELYIAFA